MQNPLAMVIKPLAMGGEHDLILRTLNASVRVVSFRDIGAQWFSVHVVSIG